LSGILFDCEGTIFIAKHQIKRFENSFLGPKRWKMREKRLNFRDFTHFKPQIIVIQPMFAEVGVSLHHKRFLMVKVYG
jgi:hypothetical protein